MNGVFVYAKARGVICVFQISLRETVFFLGGFLLDIVHITSQLPFISKTPQGGCRRVEKVVHHI